MTNPTKIHVVTVMEASAHFIQRDWERNGPAEPAESPAATEMFAGAQRVRDLLDAVREEGARAAIAAGGKTTDWADHIGPGLRVAYEAAGGSLSAS